MSKRLFGVVLLTSLLLGAFGPAAAWAVEEGEGPAEGAELPSLDELGSGTDTAREFFPEAYEEPSPFQWIYLPLVIVGLLVALVVLGMYLLWQPRFARERTTRRRR